MRDLKEITLACCIRYVRTKNGITLKELSKKTNCSLQYIGEIERGEKTVPIEKCNEIFSALNITFNYDEKAEKEESEKINQFITEMYHQNFDNIYTFDCALSYSYGFLFSLLKCCAIKTLVNKDFSEIQFVYNSIGDILQEIQGTVGALYCFLISYYFLGISDIEQSKLYIQKSLNLTKHNSLINPLLHMQYSTILENENHYLDAYKESEKALDQSKDSYSFSLSAIINMNLGIIASKMHMYQEAIQFFELSEKIGKEINNHEIIQKSNINKMLSLFICGRKEESVFLANKYSKQGNIDSYFILFLDGIIHNRDIGPYKKYILDHGYKEMIIATKYISSKNLGDVERDYEILKKIEKDFFLQQSVFLILMAFYENNNQYSKLGKLIKKIGTNHIILS